MLCYFIVILMLTSRWRHCKGDVFWWCQLIGPLLVAQSKLVFNRKHVQKKLIYSLCNHTKWHWLPFSEVGVSKGVFGVSSQWRSTGTVSRWQPPATATKQQTPSSTLTVSRNASPDPPSVLTLCFCTFSPFSLGSRHLFAPGDRRSHHLLVFCSEFSRFQSGSACSVQHPQDTTARWLPGYAEGGIMLVLYICVCVCHLISVKHIQIFMNNTYLIVNCHINLFVFSCIPGRPFVFWSRRDFLQKLSLKPTRTERYCKLKMHIFCIENDWSSRGRDCQNLIPCVHCTARLSKDGP